MKIALVQNRFTNPAWPGLLRIDESEIGATLPAVDFLVYLGPNLELLRHPDILCRYKATEPLAAIVESESAHFNDVDFPAPVGYPKFRDDFFILKSGECAEKFVAAWQGTRDVTAAAWALQVTPGLHAETLVKAHCPLDAIPKMYWGVA